MFKNNLDSIWRVVLYFERVQNGGYMLLTNSYLVYLLISVAVTLGVGHTLHKNGRAFLLDAFSDNHPLADSINRLLVVGFYLINLGFVSLFMKLDRAPMDTAESIEMLSRKLGFVLITLGVMHFVNLCSFSKFRRKFGNRPAAQTVPVNK